VVEVMMGGQRSVFEKTLDAFESVAHALDAIGTGCHVSSFVNIVLILSYLHVTQALRADAIHITFVLVYGFGSRVSAPSKCSV